MTTEETELQSTPSEAENPGNASPETQSDARSQAATASAVGDDVGDDVSDDESTADAGASGLGLSRGNLILLALAVVQIGLAAYMLWPQSTVGEAGVALLGDLDSSAISGLTIVEGENEISFEKNSGAWAIAGTDGYPTNEDSDGANKVDAALEKLIAIDGNRLVTKTPSSHKRLQVAADDFVRKVTLTSADGEQTLYIGSSAGSGATHVRLDGSDEAYLTNEISSFELSTTASSWIDTQYFSVTSDDVTALTLENGNGTFVFEREPSSGDEGAADGPGEWLLADLSENETLDQTKVNTLVNQASNMRMTQPVGTAEDASYGLDPAAAMLTLVVQESGENANPEPQTITVRIGNSPDEGTDRYAKVSRSDFVALISEFNADQLLDKTRIDFMVEPEEADTQAEGAIEEAADAGGTFTITEPITATDALTTTNSPVIAEETVPLTVTEALSTSVDLTDTVGITVTAPVSE